MTAEIRPMKIEDLPAVYRLGTRCYHVHDKPYNYWSVREVADHVEGSPELCFVAEADGEVVGAGDAVDLAGYVADAAAWAERGHAPGVAFIAAHAADVYSPPDVADPFGVEREEQSRWLASRLQLSEDGA